jgi:hypothetical protein
VAVTSQPKDQYIISQKYHYPDMKVIEEEGKKNMEGPLKSARDSY